MLGFICEFCTELNFGELCLFSFLVGFGLRRDRRERTFPTDDEAVLAMLRPTIPTLQGADKLLFSRGLLGRIAHSPYL